MKKQLINLSLFRILAALSILLFHVAYFLFLKDIHHETLLSKFVQGLTALSGFLYSQKVITDYKNFFIKNTKKILIPALACLGFMVLWNVVYMFATSNYDFISLFLDKRLVNGSSLIQFGNYYYILFILICYLITPIIQKNTKITNTISVLLVVLELTIDYFLGIPTFVTAYIFGYFLGKKFFGTFTNNEYKKEDTLVISCLSLVMVLSTTIYFLSFNCDYENFFLDRFNTFYNSILSTISGVTISFVFIYAFKFLNRFNRCKFLGFTDKLSLPIYLLNQAFFVGATSLVKYVDNLLFNSIIAFVATILASILITLLLEYSKKFKVNK